MKFFYLILIITTSLLFYGSCYVDSPPLYSPSTSPIPAKTDQSLEGIHEGTIKVYSHGKLIPVKIDNQKRFALIKPYSSSAMKANSTDQNENYMRKTIYYDEDSGNCEAISYSY